MSRFLTRLRRVVLWALLLSSWGWVGATNYRAASQQFRLSPKLTPWLSLSELSMWPDPGPDGIRALSAESCQGLTLTRADWDGDRIPDLAVGQSCPSGGRLVLYQANVEVIRPNHPEAVRRRAEGRSTDTPFLLPPRVIETSASPDFLVAGDFNADGYSDLLFAQRGQSQLYWLRGQNEGFHPIQIRELAGSVTALASGEIDVRDGREDLLVGVDSPEGPQLWIYSFWKGALTVPPRILSLPAPARAVLTGQLVEGVSRDWAVAAADMLIVGRGRDGRTRRSDTRIEPASECLLTALPIWWWATSSRRAPRVTYRSIAQNAFLSNWTAMEMASSIDTNSPMRTRMG